VSAAPRLSVVVPVHNAEPYLDEAITSILGQTFADFEVIVVDDQSTDGSLDILREYEAQHSHVRVVVLDEHVGVAGALNAGIARATAPLVARMDADDVARPERFAAQVAEMDRDPSLGLLGSQIDVIGYDGAPEERLPWELPRTHDETVWRLIGGTPICHPTVVMRTNVVRDLGGYDRRFPNEDMELWTRMAFVTRMRNLDAVLLEYRMPAVVHTVKITAWQPHITRVSQRYLEQIVGVPVAESVVLALRGMEFGGEPDDVFAALAAFGAATTLVHAFDRMEILGMFAGDGLQQVSKLMLSDVQELAARAHVHIAGRV
jgi:glycosyltransferase involved in cell wall biosynthesis